MGRHNTGPGFETSGAKLFALQNASLRSRVEIDPAVGVAHLCLVVVRPSWTHRLTQGWR